MTKVLVTESYLDGVGSGIRYANGGSDTYTPSQFEGAIKALKKTLTTKSITANGTYSASSDSADGYSQVTVNVSSGGGGSPFPYSLFVGASSSSLNVGGTINVGPFSTQNMYIVPTDSSFNTLKPNWGQPFEIKVRAKYTATHGNSMVLFGAQQGFFYCPTIEFGPNGTGIYMAVSTNGNSWTYSLWFDAQNYPLSANTWYEMTLAYDGTKIIGTVTDGTTTTSDQVSASTAPYYSSSYNLEFGGISVSGNHNAKYVIMDFSKSYSKSNGSYVWGGNT